MYLDLYIQSPLSRRKSRVRQLDFHQMYITHMTLKITARQLENAARCFLVKCAAAQPRSLEGTLVIAPFLTSLFNKSLLSGCVPDAFKVAYITPLVKKSGMDSTPPTSDRTDRYLTFLSHRSCSNELQQSSSLPTLKSLLPTASICIQDWPLVRDCRAQSAVRYTLGIDAGDLSALVLLDLSAAFGTVDHHILLQRLERFYGITGLMRQWFQSYLVGRRQFVRTGSSTSSLC